MRKCPACREDITIWQLIISEFDSEVVKCKKCGRIISKPLKVYNLPFLLVGMLSGLYFWKFGISFIEGFLIVAVELLVLITLLYLFIPLSLQPEQNSNEMDDKDSSSD